MKWFRAYHSILDSLTVRKLAPEAQLDFWWLLCCASEYRETHAGDTDGATGLTVTDAIWRTRSVTLHATLQELIDASLLRLDSAQKIVVNRWDEFQFQSDDTSARVLKLRKNRKRGVTRNVTSNGVGNVLEQSRAEQSIKSKTRAVARAKSPTRNNGHGTRLPDPWQAPEEWLEWAVKLRPDWTRAQAVGESIRFRDYWWSVAGAKGRKADWLATWRTWLRRDR